MAEVSVLVTERGSRWIEWARALRKPEHSLALIIEDASETPAQLCQRVQRRMCHFEREGKHIARVALIGGDRWDRSDLLERARLVRSLLANGPQRERAQLLLDAGDVALPL